MFQQPAASNSCHIQPACPTHHADAPWTERWTAVECSGSANETNVSVLGLWKSMPEHRTAKCRPSGLQDRLILGVLRVSKLPRGVQAWDPGSVSRMLTQALYQMLSETAIWLKASGRLKPDIGGRACSSSPPPRVPCSSRGMEARHSSLPF